MPKIMIKIKFKNTFLLWLTLIFIGINNLHAQKTVDPIWLPAANYIEDWEHHLEGKALALVGNQTTVILNEDGTYTHLADHLLDKGHNLKKVFAPEHGFRGTADAGELVKDGVDVQTGLPIISLYGKNKKPSAEQLKDIDLIIFDIQDVGVRFYTYISSLHYVMQAAAENDIKVLVLDRPNPNGHYVDGPVLDMQHTSFVGMHPIPVVHGLTIAEYASMVNRESWLGKDLFCDLHVVIMKGYNRDMPYSLPIKPSPNLPNDQSINLYPSICFFEGTPISEGRGTDMQFQVFGAPKLPQSIFDFSYTPKANEGAKYPKFENTLCHGKDLRNHEKLDFLNLEWLIESYTHYPDKKNFFTNFFTLLAGTKKLEEQIRAGWSAEKIRNSWQEELAEFHTLREKYLLYE